MTPLFHRISTDTYILINDTNSKYMGRTEFENWVNTMTSFYQNSHVVKGYFDYPSREDYIKFSGNSREMPENSLIFQNQAPGFDTWQDNNVECRSAFILLKRGYKMILSVSRRTDIPAFFPHGFIIG
ncbi:hypothetical protein FACS1894110_13820 [Spirochaetia bacterium]|nr:hypothetical protein FACS1894110_13820 [Spirochaetia bacterium]